MWYPTTISVLSERAPPPLNALEHTDGGAYLLATTADAHSISSNDRPLETAVCILNGTPALIPC